MLTALRKLLGGSGKPATERRRLPTPGPCPAIGASIVKGDFVMRVSEPMAQEFWDWLVLSGWREVRMAKNRRKYRRVPASAFGKLAHVRPQHREALWARMQDAMLSQ